MLPGLAPKTQADYEGYERALRPIFAHCYFQDVTSGSIKQFLYRSEHKAAANRKIAYLSSVFEHAMAIGWFDGPNPCRGVRRAPEKARDRYVSDDELAGFLKHASERLRLYVRLKQLTGMRKGNLLGLTRRNITPEGIDYVQNKRGKRRIIRWSPALKEVKDAILELPPRRRIGLFAKSDGTPITVSGFNSEWRRTQERAIKEADLTERFWEHDIRAKVGSDLPDTQSAATLLGHTQSKTTARHYRRRPDVVDPAE